MTDVEQKQSSVEIEYKDRHRYLSIRIKRGKEKKHYSIQKGDNEKPKNKWLKKWLQEKLSPGAVVEVIEKIMGY